MLCAVEGINIETPAIIRSERFDCPFKQRAQGFEITNNNA